MDKISFKGYQNVYRFQHLANDQTTSIVRFVAQVTNKGARDLDEMRPLLVKYPDSDNFISMEAIQDGCSVDKSGKLTIPENAESLVFLNGKNVEFSNENMPAVGLIHQYLHRMASIIICAQKAPIVTPFDYDISSITGLNKTFKNDSFPQVKSIGPFYSKIKNLTNIDKLGGSLTEIMEVVKRKTDAIQEDNLW